MDEEQIVKASDCQLDRILGFFPRVDAKASFLFAADVGMLGVMATNFARGDLALWSETIPAVIAAILLCASLLFVYRASFPALSGGAESLIYFREIAKKTEANFIEAFRKQSEDAITRDLLAQVWRNAEILKLKYDAIKISFVLTALGVVPWCLFLVASGVNHSAGVILK